MTKAKGWMCGALFLTAAAIVDCGAEPVMAEAQEPSVMFTPPATEAEEIALALSALPTTMRAGAAVYVLKSGGYRKVRDGSNGLSCLVGHDRPDTLEPICWDKEGTETILPVKLDEAVWRARGESEEAIAAKVADGFANGTYRAPRRPGVSYMMSGENFVFNGTKVIKYFPHVMSYAPYLTNTDIGADGKDPYAPWILNPGTPHAYIIVVTRR